MPGKAIRSMAIRGGRKFSQAGGWEGERRSKRDRERARKSYKGGHHHDAGAPTQKLVEKITAVLEPRSGFRCRPGGLDDRRDEGAEKVEVLHYSNKNRRNTRNGQAQRRQAVAKSGKFYGFSQTDDNGGDRRTGRLYTSYWERNSARSTGAKRGKTNQTRGGRILSSSSSIHGPSTLRVSGGNSRYYARSTRRGQVVLDLQARQGSPQSETAVHCTHFNGTVSKADRKLDQTATRQNFCVRPGSIAERAHKNLQRLEGRCQSDVAMCQARSQAARNQARSAGRVSSHGCEGTYHHAIQRTQECVLHVTIPPVGENIQQRCCNHVQGCSDQVVLSRLRAVGVDTDGFLDAIADVEGENYEAWTTPIDIETPKRGYNSIWKQVWGMKARDDPQFSLPLHTKVTTTLDLEAIDRLATIHKATRKWRCLRRFLNDASVYEQALCRQSCTGCRRYAPQEANLEGKDIITLLEKDIIRRCDDPAAYCKVFSINELSKGRRRPIEHTFAINEVLRNVPAVEFPSLPQLRHSVHWAEEQITLDFSGWFFQFPLSTAVSRFHCFTFHGEHYAIIRLPMGQRQSVALGHFVTSILVQEALRRADVSGRISANVYIDNIRLLAKRADPGVHDLMLRALACLKAVANEVRATFNDIQDVKIETKGEFLGIWFDFENQTIAMAESAKRKWDEMFGSIISMDCRLVTVRQVASLLGRAFHAIRLLGLDTAQMFFILKWFRRKASQCLRWGVSADEMAGLWPSLVPSLIRLNREITRNKPLIVKLPGEQEKITTIFTDASLTGWGCVCCDSRGRFSSFGGKWESNVRVSINVLESWAMEIGLEIGRSVAEEGAITRLISDNTAALYAAKKGNCWQCVDLNNSANRLKKEIDSGQIILGYVRSADNPADDPSRSIHPSNTTVINRGLEKSILLEKTWCFLNC